MTWEILLGLYDDEKLPYPYRQNAALYEKLAHPRLEDQIRPYICESHKSVEARKVAIRIASACKVRTLQDALVDIALDPSQPLKVRKDATDAISTIGDGRTKERLKPLISGDDDPYDDLKGYAINALWPDHISAEELFSVITPPKRNLLGIYTITLHNIVKHIQSQDLPKALEWVAKNISLIRPMSSLSHFSDEIIIKSWDNLDFPGVTEAFAKAVILLLKQNRRILSNRTESKNLLTLIKKIDDKRHRLLEAIAPLIKILGDENIYLLVHPDTPIASSKDFYWMIECLERSESDQVQQYWAELNPIHF